jgi:hypothetical protein
LGKGQIDASAGFITLLQKLHLVQDVKHVSDKQLEIKRAS